MATNTLRPSGQGGDYTSFSAWEAQNRDLVAATDIENLDIDGDWSGGADTTATTISGWTTNSSYYINIYTSGSNAPAGKWDDNKYVLSNSAALGVLIVQVPYTRLTGVQVSQSDSINHGIDLTSVGTSGGCRIVKCISKYNGVGSSTAIGFAYGTTTANADHLYVINCMALGNWGWGYYLRGNSDVSRTYTYSCTSYASSATGTIGFRSRSAYNYAKNCLSVGNGDAFLETDAYVVADYCAYDEGTDPGTNGVDVSAYSDAEIFVDIANGDFGLVAGIDTVLAGTNTSGESAPLDFTDDAAGATRTGTWNIGAREYIAAAVAGVLRVLLRKG